MRRIVTAATAALALCLCGAAQANIGYEQPGPDQGVSTPGRAQSYGFVAPDAGPVDRLSLHVHPNNQARRIVLGLYSNRSRRPFRLLRSCAIDSPSGGEGGVWNRCRIGEFVPVAGRRYHLAILGPDDTGAVAYSIVKQAIAFNSRGSRSGRLLKLPRYWSSAFRYWSSAFNRTGWTASVYADKAPLEPRPPADTTPPDTTITAGPADGSATASMYVRFEFTGSDNVGVARFECRLDGGGWDSCTSPYGYGGLAVGQHQFEVRAADTAGNVDATPASRTWTIDQPPPG